MSHVVVSGGGSGVGAATAHAFKVAGWEVTILGRRDGPLKEQNLPFAVCDVTDAGAVRAAYDDARKQRGPITCVIANAGAADSVPFAKMTADSLHAMLDVNVAGVFNCWQAALDDMTEHGGQMIAIASTASLKGYAYVAGYCAAKHGVLGLTRALSLELAPKGITVNAICPGFLDTPMTDRSLANISQKTGMSNDDALKQLTKGNPQKRLVEVDEVAGTALWLTTRAARSVNGHALSLSGGEI